MKLSEHRLVPSSVGGERTWSSSYTISSLEFDPIQGLMIRIAVRAKHSLNTNVFGLTGL